ncbi:hypothetical protein CHARACLAT_017177 [Characodon lateralis]|uniref:Uncharacterized protein n=1 Tax=Characodon lateralis TaxID=208331 RepID=A0ABU7D9J3_9TELE|nr:hypothetical protein [Characodon lateralis]
MEDNPGCAAAASAVHTISAAPPEKYLPPSGPTVESSIAPELPASTSSSSTSQAEVHCSSDCGRDLTKSHQPDHPAILSGTRRVLLSKA